MIGLSFITSLLGSVVTGKSGKMVAILGGALALTLLLGWLFWARASLKADLALSEANEATLSAANEASLATISEYREAISRQEKALADRDTAINDILAQREADRRAWKEALRHDQAAQEWSNAPLPAAARQLLQ